MPKGPWLAYNFANFLRTLALPTKAAQWSLTTVCTENLNPNVMVVKSPRMGCDLMIPVL